MLSRIHASISSEKGYHDQDVDGKTLLEMLWKPMLKAAEKPHVKDKFLGFFLPKFLCPFRVSVIFHIPSSWVWLSNHVKSITFGIVADDGLINHITLRLPGLGLWQKVIVYLMSRSHETQISLC